MLGGLEGREGSQPSIASTSVEVLGRTGIRYAEDGRTIFVDSEVLATPKPTIAISNWSIKRWDPPHQDEVVTDEARTHIAENIRQALQSDGGELQDTDKDRTF
jgi:hypothetical protein